MDVEEDHQVGFLQDLVVFFVAFPFLIGIILLLILALRSNLSKKSILFLVDFSAACFWFSIMSLMEVRNPDAEPWMWFVGCAVVLIGLLLALQYRVKGKVDVVRVLRGVWRVGIPVSFLMYIWMIITVIGEKMDQV
jgi:Protein of unknown function (DUF3397)